MPGAVEKVDADGKWSIRVPLRNHDGTPSKALADVADANRPAARLECERIGRLRAETPMERLVNANGDAVAVDARFAENVAKQEGMHADVHHGGSVVWKSYYHRDGTRSLEIRNDHFRLVRVLDHVSETEYDAFRLEHGIGGKTMEAVAAGVAPAGYVH